MRLVLLSDTHNHTLLYNPVTGTVDLRAPAFEAHGQGNLRAIAPDGTLWVRTDENGLNPRAYAFRP